MRELLPPGGARKQRSPEKITAAAVDGFDYPVTQVGATGNFTVYFAPDLGAPGQNLAAQLLNAVTAPYNDMQIFFGIAGGAVNVIIAPLSGNNEGSGGAYHYQSLTGKNSAYQGLQAAVSGLLVTSDNPFSSGQ